MYTPDFDRKIGHLWQKASNANGTTKNNHYNPQFLMRRWAKEGMLHVQDISTNNIFIKPIKDDNGKNLFIDIGYETDLYTTSDGNREDRATLEIFLGQIEDKTRKLLDRLAQTQWELPKSGDDRVLLSLFVAAMLLRLPTAIRAGQHAIQSVCEQLYGIGVEQILGNSACGILKTLLGAFTKMFYENPKWTILRYPTHRQHSADIPLFAAVYPGRELSADPNEWTIYMPLDPHALLTINCQGSPDQYLTPGTMDGDTPNEWNAPGAKYRLL